MGELERQMKATIKETLRFALEAQVGHITVQHCTMCWVLDIPTRRGCCASALLSSCRGLLMYPCLVITGAAELQRVAAGVAVAVRPGVHRRKLVPRCARDLQGKAGTVQPNGSYLLPDGTVCVLLQHHGFESRAPAFLAIHLSRSTLELNTSWLCLAAGRTVLRPPEASGGHPPRADPQRGGPAAGGHAQPLPAGPHGEHHHHKGAACCVMQENGLDCGTRWHHA